MYQASAGYVPSTLYPHGDVVIRCLACSRHNVIASAGLHAKVQVRYLGPKFVKFEDPLLKLHFNTPVTQLLFDTTRMYLLVLTTRSDHLYSIEVESCVGSKDHQKNNRAGQRWFVVPEAEYCNHFLLMANNTNAACLISDFFASPAITCENLSTFADTSIESITHLPGTLNVAVETHDSQPHALASVYTLPPWSSPVLQPSVIPGIAILPQQCAQFLGGNNASRLLILLQPDSWVRSVYLRDFGRQEYVVHFFVPEKYGSLTSEVYPVQTVDGDFAFACTIRSWFLEVG
jgi:hypothetical protein